MGCLCSVGIPSGSHAHSLSAPTQEVAIVPLLPMALVALDEMDKNSHPLYRFGPGPSGGGRLLGTISAESVFLPAQLSGGGPGQSEGF